MWLLVEQVEWDPPLLHNTSPTGGVYTHIIHVYTMFIPSIYIAYPKIILYIYQVYTMYIPKIYYV
jgi:hypothetical protein